MRFINTEKSKCLKFRNRTLLFFVQITLKTGILSKCFNVPKNVISTWYFFQAKKLSVGESRGGGGGGGGGDGYVTDEDEGAGQEKVKKNNKRDGATKKHKLAKELSDLVNYCKSTRFQDFATSQQIRKRHLTLLLSV